MRWLRGLFDPLPASGPIPELPVLGHALAMGRDPLRLLTRLAREGDVVSMRLLGLQGHLVSAPPLVEEVLRSKMKRYHRGTRVYHAMQNFLGQGILTSEGEHWRKHRRIVQPAFHRRRLQRFAESMARITARHLDEWCERRGPFAVDQAMIELTLDIIGETLFGLQVADGGIHADAAAIAEGVDAAQRNAQQVISGFVRVPLSVPTRRNRDFLTKRQALDDLAYRLIRECRARVEADPDAEHDDVLAMLVQARYEDGAPLPDRQIRDELLTLLAAGHETTSNALCWALWQLGEHPEVWRRLVAEVDAALGGRAPTIDDLPALPYARQVLDESMRLRPPAYLTGRLAAEDHELGGVPIREGSLILLSPWVTQRDPALWDNPLGFDPDRFAPQASKARHPFAFFPFGGGARKCIGESLAYLEATIVLVMIAQRLRLDSLPGHPVVPLPQITLGFEHGLRMVARPRERSSAAVEA